MSVFDVFKSKPTEPGTEPEPAASPQDGHPASEPATPEAATGTDATASSAWDRLVPELAGKFDALSDDVRIAILGGKIRASETVAKPSEAESPGPPAIRDIPQLDKRTAMAKWAQQISDGDTEGADATAKAIYEYDEAMLGALLDHGDQAKFSSAENATRIAALQQPNDIRAAGTKVQGFDEADLVAVKSLLDKGVTNNIDFAVKSVVAQRLAASPIPAPQPTPAEDAARQAAAALASSAPVSPADDSTAEDAVESFDSPAGRKLIESMLQPDPQA